MDAKASILVEGETPISKVMFDAKKILTQILHRRFLSYKESLMMKIPTIASWESAIPKTYHQQFLPSVASTKAPAPPAMVPSSASLSQPSSVLFLPNVAPRCSEKKMRDTRRLNASMKS